MGEDIEFTLSPEGYLKLSSNLNKIDAITYADYMRQQQDNNTISLTGGTLGSSPVKTINIQQWKSQITPDYLKFNPTLGASSQQVASVTTFDDDALTNMSEVDAKQKLTPEQFKKWQALHTGQNKVGLVGDYMSQSGNIMTGLGTMLNNKGLMQTGIMANSLGQAGNYLQGWQSRNTINQQIKDATQGKSTTEARNIANQINKQARIQNTASVMGAVGSVADGARAAFFDDQAANDSSTTNGINQAYDAVSSSLMAFSPVGTIIGGAMKAGAFLGDAIQSIGGGTDQMTTTDQIMDSSLFSWNIGAINGFAGKNARTFGVNQDTMAKVGSDYGGSSKFINEAAQLSGKKFGAFSSGARRSANSKMDKASGFQNTMTSIAKNAEDRRLSSVSSAQLNYLNYVNKINGDDFNYTLSAKIGAKFPRIKQVINLQTRKIEDIEWEPNLYEIEEYKEGGTINSTWKPTLYDNIEEYKEGGIIEQEEWTPVFYESISEFKKGGKTRNLEQLIAYAKEKNPRFIQRLSEEPRGIEFIDDEGNKGIGNVYLEWNTDDTGNAIIYPRIQEMEDKSLQFLSSDEAWKRANKNNNILIMSPEEAKIFFAEDPEYQTAYKRGWPNMFKNYSEKVKSSTKELKEGGSLNSETKENLTSQKNVIPDGALHKNKHHIENTEGLTQKGIPVIDNNGEQQAEVEVNEIIFSLEVTKKLEELYKSYSHYTTSSKEKDKLAIEAGKLLVQEILFNTEDNTGLINTLKNGGKINGNIE